MVQPVLVGRQLEAALVSQKSNVIHQVKMKVTIALVCLNSAATIRAALESIIQQQYRPLELIVIDGGSTDNTVEIVREYSEILGFWTSEPDRGIYDAMNKAIRAASGDVLFFLNSDDCFADPNVIRHSMNYMQSTGADMVFGDVMLVYQDKKIRKSQASVNRINFLFEGLCHQSLFVKKKVFAEIGGFDIKYRISADYDWLAKVFYRKYRCRHYPRVICDYSMNGMSENFAIQRRKENLQIQRQYLSPPLLAMVDFAYRIYRRGVRRLNS